MDNAGEYRISTNAVAGGKFWRTVVIAAMLSGMMASLSVSAGLPVPLSTAVFILSLILVILIRLKSAVYTIDPAGITERLTPYLAFSKKTTVNHFTWNEIKDWKIKKDLSRDFKEKITILIFMKNGYKIAVYSGNYSIKSGVFADFLMALESRIENHNTNLAQSVNSVEEVNEGSKDKGIAGQAIMKRKDFYSGSAAHVVFWLLVVFCAYTFYQMYATKIFKWQYLVRIGIILPGLVYMFFRLYNRSKR